MPWPVALLKLLQVGAARWHRRGGLLLAAARGRRPGLAGGDQRTDAEGESRGQDDGGRDDDPAPRHLARQHGIAEDLVKLLALGRVERPGVSVQLTVGDEERSSLPLQSRGDPLFVVAAQDLVQSIAVAAVEHRERAHPLLPRDRGDEVQCRTRQHRIPAHDAAFRPVRPPAPLSVLFTSVLLLAKSGTRGRRPILGAWTLSSPTEASGQRPKSRSRTSTRWNGTSTPPSSPRSTRSPSEPCGTPPTCPGTALTRPTSAKNSGWASCTGSLCWPTSTRPARRYSRVPPSIRSSSTRATRSASAFSRS